jgi:Domain of unknown function (DUF2341)
MPSTINDFSLDTTKISTDLGFSTDYNGEADVNILKGNPYKRAITLDNTGKTAKSNNVIGIVIDHAAIYALNETAFTFSDLRVYDADEVTELPFYVQAPNTSWTTVYVNVSSISANSTKTIYLYYGNPGLKSKSNISATLGAVFGYSSLSSWHKANEMERVLDGHQGDNTSIYNWRNDAYRYSNCYNPNSSEQPLLRTNIVNSQPVSRFDGVNDVLIIGIPNNYNLSTHSIFAVSKGSGTIISKNDNSSSTASRRKIQLSNSSTTFYYNNGTDSSYVSVTGASNTAFQLLTAISSANNAHSLGVNGTYTSFTTTLSNSTYNNSSPLIGSAFGSGIEQFNGDIAELVMFNVALSNTDRDLVASYLNAKYRLYNTADMVSINIGSQSAVTSYDYSYQSFAPFASFNYSQELTKTVGGQALTTGNARLFNLFRKTLAVGNQTEDWSVSTLDQSGGKLSVLACRKITATTSPQPDLVTIERIVDSVNINSLVDFGYTNEVESSVYVSDNEDYIELETWLEDSTLIDTATSYISFENNLGSLAFKAFLIKNINSLETQRTVRVKISKADFTQIGTGSWADMTKMRVNIQTISGSQAVYYGYAELVMNVETDTQTKTFTPIRLRNCVSSDLGATYYNKTSMIGRISGRFISQEDVDFEMIDYIKLIQDKTFSELDAFPAEAVAFNVKPALSGQDRRYAYTYIMSKILGFIFPKLLLRVDLDMFAEEKDRAANGGYNYILYNLNYFHIHPNDKIGEVIDKILNPTFGYLTYDTDTNKLVVKSGYTYFAKKITYVSGYQSTIPYDAIFADYFAPTPLKLDIFEFSNNTKSNGSDSNSVYNYIPITIYKDTVVINSNFLNFLGDKSYELKPNGKTTVFFGPDEFIKIFDFAYILSGTMYPSSFNCGASQYDTAYNNAGVTITNWGHIGNKCYVELSNTNTTTRWLRGLALNSNFLSYQKVTTFNTGVFDQKPRSIEFSVLEVKDNTSITKFGRKQYDINNLYNYQIFYDLSLGFVQNVLYREFVQAFKNPVATDQVVIDYNPYLSIGSAVTYRNKHNRIVQATITKLMNYSESGDHKLNLTAREIS